MLNDDHRSGDLVLDPTPALEPLLTSQNNGVAVGSRLIPHEFPCLGRSRIMGARYPMYLLADSKEGQIKEAELSRSVPSESATYGNIKHGFVYQRVPHITLKSIANNAEIDVIWDGFSRS